MSDLGAPTAAIGLGLAVILLGACELNLTSSDDGPLRVQKLRISESSTGQVVTVSGGATGASVDGSPAASVRVTTAGGDRESLTVDRNICHTDDGDPIVCDEFNLGLEDDRSLDESIRDRIREIDGRILRTFSFGAATVKIFSGELEDALEEALAWPGVEYAEPNGIFRIASRGDRDADSVRVRLSGSMPVEEATPTRDDGVLQVTADDTARAVYRGADGDEVTARLSAWPDSAGS